MNQCKDCRWWGEYKRLPRSQGGKVIMVVDPHGIWQDCNREAEDDAPMRSHEDDYGNTHFQTRPTFGCVEFQRRE